MHTLLRQEAYKVIKGKALWVSALFLLVFQLAVAIAAHQYKFVSPNYFVENAGGSGQMVEIIMVVIASTLITNEFVNHTIKNLLARQYSRTQVFLSKLITLVWIYVGLVIVDWVITFALKLIFFPKAQLGSATMKAIRASQTGQVLYVFLLLAIVILVSNIAKSSGGAIGIGGASIFATSIIGSLLALIITKVSWFKYNPFNFFMVESQYSDHQYHLMTHLSLTQITVGTLIYGIILYGIAGLIFNRRNV